MPDISTLILFSLAVSALVVSPGPDMLLIASRSAAQGRSAGFATWAGIAAGTYVHAVAAAFGLSKLFLHVPVAYEIVRYAGAAYLLYLAWKLITSRDGTDDGVSSRSLATVSALFKQGLYTNLLNPKMAVFILALFPQFLEPNAGSVLVQCLVFATIHNLVGLLVNGTIIVTASGIGSAFSKNARFQWVSRYILGAVFAGLAIRLALSERR